MPRSLHSGLPEFLGCSCEGIEVRHRPRSRGAVLHEPVKAIRADQLRAIRRDNVVEALDPHVGIRSNKLVIRHVVEHSLDEIGRSDALSDEPSRIIVLRMFLKTRTMRLKFWFVAWC